jgi:site-specific recombinase XerD
VIKKVKTTPTGKNWEVNIKIGGRNGKHHKRLFATQAEAKRFETELVYNNNKSKDWNSSGKVQDNRSLFELCNLWYKLHGKNLKDGAARLVKLQALCSRLKNPRIIEFNSQVFSAYRSKRLDEVSANTVNHEHSYLGAVFNELIRLGELSENPIKTIRKIKIQETELCFLTNEQINLLLSETSNSLNSSLTTVVKICLSTGARWSEAEQLKISQVVNSALHLSKTKSGKNRTLPINDDLEKEILSELPFKSCRMSFINAMNRAGIKTPAGQSTHILRHTFASQFMANGGNILVLQRALGHADIKMTIRYAHFAPDHLQEIKELNPLKQIKKSKTKVKLKCH